VARLQMQDVQEGLARLGIKRRISLNHGRRYRERVWKAIVLLASRTGKAGSQTCGSSLTIPHLEPLGLLRRREYQRLGSVAFAHSDDVMPHVGSVHRLDLPHPGLQCGDLLL
jgi:hypothetical protein